MYIVWLCEEQLMEKEYIARNRCSFPKLYTMWENEDH